MQNGEFYYREYINGNDRAFEEIVKSYYDGLVFFINRYVRSLSDAEDVANECFVYIAIHKKKFNFKTSLKTYLYTIGRSRALNFLRKNKRKEQVNLDDYANVLSCDTMLEDEFYKKEKYKILYNAISSLPNDMQNVVYLYYFENMSYEEIAKVTSKKFKQVDNMLYRAKKALKTILDKKEFPDE